MLRNKIRYILLLVSLGLLSILYNDYIMGILFMMVVILPLFIFGLLCYVYGKITAEISSIVHVTSKGENIPIGININNPTNFPIPNMLIYLSYNNTFSNKTYKKEFSVTADRKTSTRVTLSILSEHSGNIVISIKKIRVYDYFMLFSLRKKQKGDIKVAILPQFHELSEEYLANRCKMIVDSDYFSTVKKGDDPSEVFTIREYREGDKLQRIHWKLSVKQNQLMIKDFSDPINCSVLIFANLIVQQNENVLVYMDALLESALSLSYSFLLQGQMHYFTWYDSSNGICRRIRITQEKDLFEAVDGLLQTKPYFDGVDVIPAYLAEHPNDQYTDLFYVTGEVTGTQLDALSMIKAGNRQIICINDYNRMANEKTGAINTSMSVDIINQIREMGVGYMMVDVMNIKGTLEQLQLS